jgi:DNA-binding transcriptional ArsR family regulator
MSLRPKGGGPPGRGLQTPVFAALGDETRLRLVGRLCNGERLSISKLSEGSKLTRQAITKHLRVLEDAGLVQGMRQGREMRFTFAPGPLEEAKRYLEVVSRQWEQALERLKSFVESGAGKTSGNTKPARPKPPSDCSPEE